MATRLIPLADLSGRHLGAWNELSAHVAEPNPFFEPYFVLSSIRRSGATGAHLLVVERDGGWIACVPVRRRGAPPLSALQSWCDEYCFLGTPLVERHSVREAVESLLSAASERQRLMVFERLALDGPIGATLGQLLESCDYQVVLERRADRAAATEPPPKPAAKETRERRRLLRRLQDEVGAEVEVRDRSEDPCAIDDFLHLEAESWKGRAGTAFASRPADEDFLRQICTAFRNEGRLQVLELGTSEGPPLAITCNLVAGDTEFGFKTAYDERYRRCAPGVQLIYANRDAFYKSNRRLLDSCSAPDSALINRIMPERRPIATLVIGPSGVRGALARGAAKAAATVHARRRGRAAGALSSAG